VDWSTIRSNASRWEVPELATTVVVPHPDDEVLLFGGLIQLQRRRGVDVHVIAVTDGEASYRDVDAVRLAALRRREQTDALGHLGVAAGSVHRLGIADGEVASQVEAVAAAIVELGTPLVVAPWARDHHCDHEACGVAALRAAAVTGADTHFGLFWTWTHTEPARIDGHRLTRIGLPVASLTGRRRAIGMHRSQITDDVAPALLSDRELEPLRWTYEYYVAVEPDDVEPDGDSGRHV
jgi:LmbE family N-acetylglucosaminyl deacetylase